MFSPEPPACIPSEGHVVRCLPTVGTVAALPFGATLIIPAGALDKPQIFHVGVSDTGDVFPVIDIYPYSSYARQLPSRPWRLQAAVPAVVRWLSLPKWARPRERPSRPSSMRAGWRMSLIQTMLVKPDALE